MEYLLPYCSSQRQLSCIRNELLSLWKENRIFFESVFVTGNAKKLKGEKIKYLLESGLLQIESNKYFFSPYRIIKYEKLFLITDRFDNPSKNRVFPLSKDESLYLACKLKVQHGINVLDFGTGCGIFALVSLQMGAKLVVAVEVNLRAIYFAKLNAQLNSLAGGLEIIFPHELEEYPANKFDLICTDPPVVPCPPNSGLFVHSDGGPYGTVHLENIIEKVPKLLKSNGYFQLVTLALGTDKSNLLEDLLRIYLSRIQFSYNIYNRYSRPLINLTILYDYFKSSSNYISWQQELNDKKFKCLHYFYCEAKRDGCGFIGRQSIKIQKSKNSGTWEKRLRRLFFAF